MKKKRKLQLKKGKPVQALFVITGCELFVTNEKGNAVREKLLHLSQYKNGFMISTDKGVYLSNNIVDEIIDEDILT